MTDEHAPVEKSLRSPSARVQEFYDAHAAGLMLFVMGMLRDRGLAEDVLQQTFSKLQRELQNRSEQEGSQEITSGWLFKVAHNEALQIRRKEHREQRHAESLGWFQQGLREHFRDPLVSSEQQVQIQRAIMGLPVELKLIVELRIFEDLKFREIAERLQVPQGTVITRMSRAISILRQQLQSDFR